MRKASYTDRKLTVKEQAIAEKYFDLVKAFLYKKYYIYYDQMIDDISFAYIQAIKKYTDYERLHCYKIETIIYKSLEGAAANYFRKRNCLKRKPQRDIISYDDKKIECSKVVTQIEKAHSYNIEKLAISNLMLYDIFCKIQIERQKRIIIMLIEGYKKVEIQRYFDITYYRLQKETENIRKIVNEMYSDN